MIFLVSSIVWNHHEINSIHPISLFLLLGSSWCAFMALMSRWCYFSCFYSNVANQASGAQVIARPAASSSSATVATSFDSTTASPLPYANSPKSGINMMNVPSPQQQQLQQQRQKIMQLPHQQQILAQQPFKQSPMQGLGQVNWWNSGFCTHCIFGWMLFNSDTALSAVTDKIWSILCILCHILHRLNEYPFNFYCDPSGELEKIQFIFCMLLIISLHFNV